MDDDEDISDAEGGGESFENNIDGTDVGTATSIVAPVVAPVVASVVAPVVPPVISGGASVASSITSNHRRSNTPVFNSSSGGRSSSVGKTKNSTNRDRASVTKSIQELTAVMGSWISGANTNSNELGFAMMQMQMMQQSQMQMQMQLAEMKEQGKQSLKFLKAIAKQGKKKRKRGGDESSSSSSSDDDN